MTDRPATVDDMPALLDDLMNWRLLVLKEYPLDGAHELATVIQRAINALSAAPPAPANPPTDDGELPVLAHEYMKAFYVSQFYDPKAPRHADVVQGAIQFTLAALSSKTRRAEVIEECARAAETPGNIHASADHTAAAAARRIRALADSHGRGE